MDVLIKNGLIADGTLSEPYKADIAVRGDKIAAIGRALPCEAGLCIDARGMLVTPGFIDCHSHSDNHILMGTSGYNYIEQGITTEIAGQCGSSAAPGDEDDYALYAGVIPEDVIREARAACETPERFMERVSGMELPTNMAFFIGHGSVRQKVMGFSAAKPDVEQLGEMKALVSRAVDAGFMGVSSGLIYPPSVYADTDELAALACAAAERGGMYASHIRGEGDFCIPAVKEAIEIGRRAGCPVEISHHKIEGARNEGNSAVTLALVQEANAQGIPVGIDQYPFIACSTGLISALPPCFMTEGDKGFLKNLADHSFRDKVRHMVLTDDKSFDNILPVAGFDKWMIVDAQNEPGLSGKSIADVAEERGLDPFDAIYELLLTNDARVRMAYFTINQSDMISILSDPLVMCGTDGYHLYGRKAYDAPPSTHPRMISTFPRNLRLTRQKTSLSVAQAIRRVTGLPADRHGLGDIGYIREGARADICVFDWEKLGETNDYMHPYKPNTGIEHVFVGGKHALKDGRATGEKGGILLRRS
ncbi:MAG TPA: amidohydrolase family protein [Clostridia bacterium]|nr:amidohydrolase family protein [Clostridia bacterium]